MADNIGSVEQLRNALVEESTSETIQDYVEDVFGDGFDVGEYGEPVPRPPRNFPLVLASPSVMVELVRGMRLFAPTRMLETQAVDGTRRVEILYGREFAVAAEYLPRLPALLRDDMETVIQQIDETGVITDAQERVSYEDNAPVARGIERRDLVNARITAQHARYDEDEVAVTRMRANTEYLYQTVELKLAHNLPALMQGLYFLAVPYKQSAVYPVEDGDEWNVQRPFIMSLDYAELERLRWVRRSPENDEIEFSDSVSGTIRGTRAVPYVARENGVTRDIGLHTDYAARTVQLYARHAPGDTTFIRYDRPHHYSVLPYIWEERVPVSYDAWRANATDAERRVQARQMAPPDDAHVPTRRRVMVDRYYMSVIWELILLGTSQQTMSDDRFWARHVALMAQTEPTVVETPPPVEEVSTLAMHIIDKRQYLSISRFISQQRMRATPMSDASAQ